MTGLHHDQERVREMWSEANWWDKFVAMTVVVVVSLIKLEVEIRRRWSQ